VMYVCRWITIRFLWRIFATVSLSSSLMPMGNSILNKPVQNTPLLTLLRDSLKLPSSNLLLSLCSLLSAPFLFSLSIYWIKLFWSLMKMFWGGWNCDAYVIYLCMYVYIGILMMWMVCGRSRSVDTQIRRNMDQIGQSSQPSLSLSLSFFFCFFFYSILALCLS